MWATLSTKGQLVIPRQLRETLQWSAGDHLELLTTPDGALLVRREQGRPVLRLRGMLQGGPSLTKELEAAHREEMLRDNARLGPGALTVEEEKGGYDFARLMFEGPDLPAITPEELLRRPPKKRRGQPRS